MELDGKAFASYGTRTCLESQSPRVGFASRRIGDGKLPVRPHASVVMHRHANTLIAGYRQFRNI